MPEYGHVSYKTNVLEKRNMIATLTQTSLLAIYFLSPEPRKDLILV